MIRCWTKFNQKMIKSEIFRKFNILIFMRFVDSLNATFSFSFSINAAQKCIYILKWSSKVMFLCWSKFHKILIKIEILKIIYFSMQSFDCTSSPRAMQVDALARVVNKRIVGFMLESGSATFDDFMCDFIWFSIYFDAQSQVNSIESLYINVKRSFGCRKYGKVLLRKSYIADQISHFWNIRGQNF